MALPRDPSASPIVDADRVRAQIKRWQERLLDLTKGNPLLGINRSRVSKLLVTEPDCQGLFSLFALQDEAELKMPRVVKIPKQGPSEQTGPVDEPDNSDYRIEPGDIAFDAKPLDLLRRLRRIFDNARTTIEERGVTTLHLSFGVLKWADSALGESISPLCLVPCELESSGPDAPLLLRRSDEELQLNPALELYLRERHKVQLPSLSDEPDSGTLEGLFEGVSAAVRPLGWRVEEETWLSTYTFESLVLYKDLKAFAELALQHPVVIGLARAGSPPEASEALGEERLDSLPTPDQVPIPVLVTDSSQLKALTVARGERHLVIHGPPGTGKSQTIANLIADALGRSKRVLFVSAKMAALDVVHVRLKHLGLDRFCLEAHSTKAGKAKIIEELRRTLEAAQDIPHQQSKERLDDLLRLRDELNAYVRQLHALWPALQLTSYEAIGIIEKLRNAPSLRAPLPWQDLLNITRSQLTSVVEALDELASHADVFDRRADHPWEGLTAVDPAKPLNREALESHLLSLHDGLTKLRTELTTFSRIWGIPPAEQLSLDNLQPLAAVLGELATLDRLPAEWATRDIEELSATIALLNTAAGKASELSTKRAHHLEVLKLPPSQALHLLQQTDTEFQSWSRIFRRGYWRWRTLVRGSVQPRAAADTRSLRTYLVRIRRILALERWFEVNAAALSRDAGVPSSFTGESLKSAAKRVRLAVEFRAALDACHVAQAATSPPLSDDARRNTKALSSLVHDARLMEAIQYIDVLWPRGFVGGISPLRAPVPALLARCAGPLANLHKLHEWIVLQLTLHRCHDLGLTPFIDALGGISAKLARAAFERRFYVAWTNAAVDASPALASFCLKAH